MSRGQGQLIGTVCALFMIALIQSLGFSPEAPANPLSAPWPLRPVAEWPFVIAGLNGEALHGRASTIIILCLVIPLVSLLGLLLWAYLAREDQIEAPELLSAPPDDLAPALALVLVREGLPAGSAERAHMATIYDLIRRGAWRARPERNQIGELDLWLEPTEQIVDSKNLYEARLVRLIGNLIGEKGGCLGDLAEQIATGDPGWVQAWLELDRDLYDCASHDSTGAHYPWQARGIAALLFALGGLSFLLGSVIYVAFIPVLVAVLFALVPARYLVRMDPEERERQLRWRAFARWLEEFPRLEELPPATLLIWEEILCYGLAFGSAERLLSSSALPPPGGFEALFTLDPVELFARISARFV